MNTFDRDPRPDSKERIEKIHVSQEITSAPAGELVIEIKAGSSLVVVGLTPIIDDPEKRKQISERAQVAARGHIDPREAILAALEVILKEE